MKRLPLVVFGLLLAVGCSSSSSTPSNTTSGTTTTRFIATLSPAQETPVTVTGPEAAGSGVATIDFNITRDASGAITAATTNFTVTLQNFPATTVVNIAHIHTGAAGVAGPILVNTSITPGEVVLSNGAGSFTRAAISVTGGGPTAQSILDNPAGFYFNVHTAAFPGGVMRGQLVKQ
jgi:ABC-type glycerol-3-phosphate transport system substrate-binding protein